MRLIDADELENEVVKRAFEGKLEWSVNDLKQLIRKQPEATVTQLGEACDRNGMRIRIKVM